ncbi:MAG: TOBE domain-containing protein, partial [Candidatus Aminicenantes bacterium]|nr:TOBE domain-containing protein [Candidatus Aminicenantes bacterium]
MVNGENSSLSYVAIRSDDIFLSEKKISSSARNSFHGVVIDIVKKSTIVEVVVDIGFPLSVDITRRSFVDMKISIGKKIWATFKVSSVRVFTH